MGLVNVQLSKYSEALKYFDRLCKVKGYDIELYFELSNIHYKLGNHTEALNWIEKIIKKDSLKYQSAKVNGNIKEPFK